MKNNFLDIKVGDKVVVYDEYSHDYVEHILKVNCIEYHKDWITETNPKGMLCFGTDFQEDEYGDDYITQVHEGNFVRIVKEREKLWVCSQCLAAIESHEGNQSILCHDIDFEYDEEEFDEMSKCDWCGEIGFDTLYELI